MTIINENPFIIIIRILVIVLDIKYIPIITRININIRLIIIEKIILQINTNIIGIPVRQNCTFIKVKYRYL